MSIRPRKILVVGVSSREFERVAPLLQRHDFAVDRFPGAAGALQLLATVPFEVLIVGYPLDGLDLDSFLQVMRKQSSRCRHSSVLLLARRDDQSAAERYVGWGANRVLCLEDSENEVQAALSSVLDVAPRKAARVIAQLAFQVDHNEDLLLCRTVNGSASGVLIVTDQLLATGTQVSFEFQLPLDRHPVVGVAEVVRHTRYGRDRVTGVGMRFLSFAGDSQRRYNAYLEHL